MGEEEGKKRAADNYGKKEDVPNTETVEETYPRQEAILSRYLRVQFSGTSRTWWELLRNTSQWNVYITYVAQISLCKPEFSSWVAHVELAGSRLHVN
jgi:hypothetical protein